MDRIVEARAFVRGELVDCCLGIDEANGTIEVVKKVLTGAPVERYPGRIVLPSAVDLHVHFRDPGNPDKEDFRSGTTAALLGGVGTVLDMPNTDPPTDTTDRIEEKIGRIRPKAVVDYGLWGMISSRTSNPEKFARLCDGLKLYMSPTTAVRAMASAEDAEKVLAAAHIARRVVAVHAESVPVGEAGSLADHAAQRTVEGELAAIEQLASVARRRDRVHVCHASARVVAERAAEKGFSWGATPHHLLLSMEARWARLGKVNPPLRPVETQSEFLRWFLGGTAGILESDHAPHTLEEKERPFAESPPGFPGVQTLLPLFLARVKSGEMGLARLMAVAAEAPAALLGLRKGKLEFGYDADYVVVDLRKTERIDRDWLASRAGWSPFEGAPAIVPRQHVLRGQLAVEDGEVVRRPGSGRRVARS